MPCIWKEVENGKGDVYKVSCLGQSSNGVNIFKVCKKKHITPTQIFLKCPYCGNRVQIVPLKK